MLLSLMWCNGCNRKDTHQRGSTPKVNTSIELTGSGLGQPTVLSFEQLASMPMVQLDDVMMLKTHEDNELTSWQGPALETLLTAAQLKPGPMIVNLEAEDGYAVDARLEDLTGAIVAIKDGQGCWLTETDEKCVLKLVPPHLPGNFWVVNLRRIHVEPTSESTP